MTTSPNVTKHDILPAQARAGRALIGWTREELASRSKLPDRTVARFELADGNSRPATVAAIRAALEAAGVEFIEQNGGGPGVRLRQARP